MKFFCIFFFCIASLVALPSLRAQDPEQDPDWLPPLTALTLKWSPNLEPDLAGYVVYYGLQSGVYKRSVTVTEPTATISVPTRFVVYFAVTAFNSEGEESAYSDEVHWP